MAKRKRTALFEVIQKHKRDGAGGGALPLPSWYGKGKGAAPMPPAAPVAQTAPQPVVGRAKATAGPSVYEIFLGKARQLPLTQTSVAIIAGAIVVALAVGAGWMRWGHRAASGTPEAQAALNGPAHPEVMDVAAPRAQERASVPAGAPPAGQATPASATQTPTRQSNLSYVRIRLLGTQKSAAAERDLLAQHGIPCTVEHNVPGVQMPFYAVVGLQPFVSAGTAEYSDYISRVKSVLVGGGDTRALSPQLIKWTGSVAEAE